MTVHTPSAAPASFEARRQAIFERLAPRALERLDPEHHLTPCKPLTTGLHSQAAGFGIRDSANALVALAMTGREQRAWQVLDSLLAYQDTDPASFTCGNFRWYSGWTRVRDPNAASFMVPKLAYVLRHRGQAMPAELRQRLEDALALAVDGLNAHRCAWEYTNIWLLNTASKLMIGDVLDDRRARDLGYLDWEEWRNWTARLGAIPEANCPGYTFVHLDAMALMLSCQLDEAFLHEVRMMLRHLLSSVVLDYHPGISVVTGPKSRGTILRRGTVGLDTILHFVLDTPEPIDGCDLWLGAPIGRDDLLPIAENLSLPRRTHSRSHGLTRFNYLNSDYTLGGFSGKGGFSPQRIPFFIAHRTSANRCTVSFEVSSGKGAEACYADQDEGRMLAAGVWMIADRPIDKPALKDTWLSRLTGLNCGRPDNLLYEDHPGFEVALGSGDDVRLFTPAGPVTVEPGESIALDDTTLVLQCERVRIGMRWFAHGDSPALKLHRDGEGASGKQSADEMRLTVEGSREGLAVSPNERAAMIGMLVDIQANGDAVSPAQHAAALADASLSMDVRADQWRIEANADGKRPLAIHAEAQPNWLYAVDQQRVGFNQWAQSLKAEA